MRHVAKKYFARQQEIDRIDHRNNTYNNEASAFRNDEKQRSIDHDVKQQQ